MTEKDVHSEMERRNEELRSLYETSKLLASTLDRDQVLSLIVKRATGMVGACNCFIFEVDRKRNKLRCIAASHDEAIDFIGWELGMGEGISGLVAVNAEGMLIERADLDARSLLVDGTNDDPSSIISVPLKMGDEVLGVMTMEKTPGTPFTWDEYHLIEMMSLHAAISLKNAATYLDLKDMVSQQQMYNVLLTHDVANYNVPIHGFLEMLIKDPKLDERERRFIRSCLVQSDNISNLIADVRKLWWLRTKEGEFPLRPMDLVAEIKTAIESIHNHCLYGNIGISFLTERNTAISMVDPFIRDVFYNLLSNACKYGDHKPVIVSLQEQTIEGKRYWRVNVRDQGRGIPDDRKSLLFHRFEGIDPTQASEGHGLGLSVVKAFCDRYRAKVWVEDSVPGDPSKGSVFCLLFSIPNTLNE